LSDTPKILVALDFDDLDACLSLVDQLDPKFCRLKVGKEMFTLFGPQLIETLQLKGFDVFLDLKFHDIPTTVSKALKAAASLGVWMVNVHASGGQRMLDAAAEAVNFLCVTPGIRPAFASKGDQHRIMTPAEALAAGSDYLVIGRPITQAKNPLEALRLITDEMSV